MKVLQIHKYYWHRDGASNYMLYLSDLLKNNGHEVIPFAMRGDKNLKTPFSKFFVSEVRLDNPNAVNFFNKIKYTCRMFYSFEAKKKMRQLLRNEKIDIAHIHNIYHQISPSILVELKKNRTPIVMTLHDYKLICPNYTMFHHGAIHEEDCQGWYGTCVKNKCMKDSRGQSRIVRAEMIFHHKIARYYERLVDKFIAPSEFILKKCVEHGFDKKKFIHIPHPIDIKKYTPLTGDKGIVSYIGRLSEEKGIEVLLEAARSLPEIDFMIVGDGPIEKKLKKTATMNVKFTGFLTGDKLMEVYKNSKLIVVPSIWYENYPLSVLEPKAMAKVVLGSDIGGISELLSKDLLFKAGDSEELALKIKKYISMSFDKLISKGEKLREEVLNVNDPKKHLKKIESLYLDLVE